MATNWRLVALLYAAGLLAAGQFAKVALSLDALARVYPEAEALLPYAVSALSLVGLVFGATAGAFAARVGLKPVLLGGLGVAGVLSFAQADLPPLALLLVLRTLEGAAHLAIVVAAPTLLANVAEPRHQPAVMGLWGTFFGVGFSLSALVANPLLGIGGAPAVFLAHGLAMLLLAVGLLFWLPGPPAEQATGEGWIAQHLAIYRSPSIVAPAIGFFWHTAMFLGLLTYLPGFLGPPSASLLPLVALIGTMGAGLLARRFAPRRLLFAAYGGTIVLAAALYAAPESLALPVSLLFIIAVGMVPGAAFASVPAYNRTDADRARSNGAIAQLGNLGTALSAPMFAATLGLGLIGPLGATVVLSLAGWLAVAAVHRAMAVQPGGR